MSQLFELQPENLNGHGIQRLRPHKSPDKTIIISKEGEKERGVKQRGRDRNHLPWQFLPSAKTRLQIAQRANP